MYRFAPTLVLIAAFAWPAAVSAQSLAEVAQREAARKKAEAAAAKAGSTAVLPPQSQAEPQDPSSVSSPSGAISLAEIARTEAARRKALAAAGQHGKVLTTSDVKKWEAPEDGPTPDTSGPEDKQKAADGKTPATADAGDARKGADEPKGEEYWHTLMTAAREELRRNEAFAEALQSRINALSAEFSSKDDPYQRAQIADDRQKALAELDRLTEDIDKNKKAISGIEEDARRAGVPAGWIR